MQDWRNMNWRHLYIILNKYKLFIFYKKNLNDFKIKFYFFYYYFIIIITTIIIIII